MASSADLFVGPAGEVGGPARTVSPDPSGLVTTIGPGTPTTPGTPGTPRTPGIPGVPTGTPSPVLGAGSNLDGGSFSPTYSPSATAGASGGSVNLTLAIGQGQDNLQAQSIASSMPLLIAAALALVLVVRR